MKSKQVGKARERVKIKIIVPFSSYPTSYKEFQKKIKNFKKLEKWFLLLFKPVKVWKGQERVKIKIIVPICSYPTRYKEFQKFRKKIQKIKKPDHFFFSCQNKLGKAEKV